LLFSSPNFDQECWDRREAFKKIQKHNNELLENDKVKQLNIPKCPTCGSTDIKKISVMSKAVGATMLDYLVKQHEASLNVKIVVMSGNFFIITSFQN